MIQANITVGPKDLPNLTAILSEHTPKQPPHINTDFSLHCLEHALRPPSGFTNDDTKQNQPQGHMSRKAIHQDTSASVSLRDSILYYS